MRWMAVAALLALEGCGGAGGDALAGTSWFLSEGVSCAAAADFDRDHGYKLLSLCDTGGGTTFDVSAEIGDYMIDGDQLRTTPAQTTCPATTSADAVRFAVIADSLAIYLPDGALVLQRNTSAPSSGGIVIRYGCFDSAGNFTPSPLVSI